MDQPYLSANQLLAQSEANSHRHNLFKTVLGSQSAVPLDGSGIFSLIRTERYNETIATMEEGQKIKHQLEEKCYTMNLRYVGLEK